MQRYSGSTAAFTTCVTENVRTPQNTLLRFQTFLEQILRMHHEKNTKMWTGKVTKLWFSFYIAVNSLSPLVFRQNARVCVQESVGVHFNVREKEEQNRHLNSYKAIHFTSSLFIQMDLTYLLFDASPCFIWSTNKPRAIISAQMAWTWHGAQKRSYTSLAWGRSLS